MNIVELINADESAFDQPCKFGNRVEDHAVYCHNEEWEDSPRKCRRSWYTGGEIKDEDCPGFERNESYVGELAPTPINGTPCSVCTGKKITTTVLGSYSTCEHCQGDGVEPQYLKLSEFEMKALSLRNVGDLYVCKSSGEEEFDSMRRLIELNLLKFRMFTPLGNTSDWLVCLTGKGAAVLEKWLSK